MLSASPKDDVAEWSEVEAGRKIKDYTGSWSCRAKDCRDERSRVDAEGIVEDYRGL